MESELHQKVLDRINSMGFQYMDFTVGSLSGKHMYMFKCEHGCRDVKYENSILQYEIICDKSHALHFHVIYESE
jgi:hypothetical protein